MSTKGEPNATQARQGVVADGGKDILKGNGRKLLAALRGLVEKWAVWLTNM
jgi:hypothetical protein